MMKAEFSKPAIKFIEKLDIKTQSRIRIKLLRFISLVEEHGVLPSKEFDIKFLKGSWKPLKRMRIGNFRVIFDIDFINKILKIYEIDNRGDIY
jgi:mRNA-degrading endonuclease RelE of RelBE toxin-antitoxin system